MAILIAISQVHTALRKISLDVSPITFLATGVNNGSLFAHQMNACVSSKARTHFYTPKSTGASKSGATCNMYAFPIPGIRTAGDGGKA